MYVVGVDIGTTYTAAAVWRDGVAEIATLGDRSTAIPSVVLRRDDGTFLVGHAADRRSLTEPGRAVREFKRRFGDTTPILLGGAPHSPELLTAQLLRAAIDHIAEMAGSLPAHLCLTHPANWGPYKTDLLRQAVRLADLELPVTLTTEPEAAAISYAQTRPLPPGATVAVYDLGGGTFDAAVLRRASDGFAILGQPEGIEHLGGLDFDAAVFDHVRQSLGDQLADLDEDDPATLTAVSRLREECTRAREALSADTEATVPVLLPGVSTQVRLTRAELEAMVRPALTGTLEALRRALRSAGVSPEELHSILLVGGASRTPLVAQLVTAEFGRPIAVDTHPKHAVALGAAHLAARQLPSPTVAPASEGTSSIAATAPIPSVGAPLPPPAVSPAAGAPPSSPPAFTDTPSSPPSPATGRAAVPVRPSLPPEDEAPKDAEPIEADPRSRRWPLLVAAVVLLVALGVGGIAAALRGEPDPPPGIDASSPSPSPSPSATSPSPTPSTEASPTPAARTREPAYSAPPPPPSPPKPSPSPSPTTAPSPSPRTVVVPDVFSRVCTDAIAALEAEGFVVETTAHSHDLPVVAQDPPAGTAVPPGSTIWLTCSYPDLGE